MTYKQFRQWCNERACDGCLGHATAVYCIRILNDLQKIPFWRRKKTWKKIETGVLYAVVNPVNQKIQEMRRTYNDQRNIP